MGTEIEEGDFVSEPDGHVHRVKSVGDDHVTLAPANYDDIDPVEIPIDEVEDNYRLVTGFRAGSSDAS